MTRNLERDRNRGQDVTAWGISDASHPAPVRIDEDGNLYVLQANAGATPWNAALVAQDGTPLPLVDYKLQVSAVPYSHDIAQGLAAGHAPWSKIGYVPIGATTETDVWSYGGTTAVVPLLAVAAPLKVQTNNAADAGTSIFAGTASGGTAYSLIDGTKNFNGGTAVAVGDCVVLEAAGATPEWGFVTAVTSNTELAVAGGFSSGGVGAGRTYSVIDYSNQAGAHAVLINGLDANWDRQREIVVTAGAGPGYRSTVRAFLRVNSFRVIATGSNGKPTAAIALMDAGAVPATTYSYITAGFTRARNSIYTVPRYKTLYIEEGTFGYAGSSANQNCRVYVRAGQYQFEGGGAPFISRITNGVNIWYPQGEVVCANVTVPIQYPEPIKILGKCDLKVSAYATGAGVLVCALRGYLEDA